MIHHIWGLSTRPDREWQEIRGKEESTSHMYLTHIPILTVIPAIPVHTDVTQVGWMIGGGDPVKLTQTSVLQMTILIHLTILAEAVVMNAFAH